jgi:hypothetical protein
MDTFMQKHAPLVKGTISAPDRIILKGYLPFANPAAAEGFLNKNNIKFIEFKKFAKAQSEKLVTAAQSYATNKKRPYEYHEFFIRRQGTRKGETISGWFPMAKRITNMYRYCEIGLSANRQYIEELSIVDDPTTAYAFVEKVCSKTSPTSKRCRALNPLGHDDRMLFRATLRGEHFINGFRHADVAKNLGIVLKGKEDKEYKKLSARISRKIKLLHAHGLIAKIPRSRRYRITFKGKCIMSAAIHIHENFIPAAFKNAA